MGRFSAAKIAARPFAYDAGFAADAKRRSRLPRVESAGCRVAHHLAHQLRFDSDAIIIAEIFAKKTRKTPPDIIAGEETRMKQSKRDKLRKLGYHVTDTQSFLGLSDEEMALIDLKISLIEKVKATRALRKITQRHLAQLIHSSQSRIAMLERGRPDVSLDRICRALFAMGVGRLELGRTITSNKAA
jgi:DNA-binding XRE family transcriptional regulator